MSSNELFGANLKEWSLIILMIALAFTFGIVGISFAIAVWNTPPGTILLTGSFDLSQWQAIVVGIAIVATVLVSQQLTKKDNAVVMQMMKEMFNKKTAVA